MLEYEKGKGLQFRFQDPDVMRKILVLEDFVEARAEVSRTTEDKNREEGGA